MGVLRVESKIETVVNRLLSLFGCPHRHTTFPRCRIDARGRPVIPRQHYVVCLDCAEEIDYRLFDTILPSRTRAEVEAETEERKIA